MMRRYSLWLVVCCSLVACGGDEGAGDDGGGGNGAGATVGAGAGTTGSGAGSTGGACGHAGDAEQGALVGTTAAHNAARCNTAATTPLPLLAWSADLAATAQAYADSLAAQGCPLQHSMGPYGENIFWGSGSYDPQTVVDAWMSEEPCYEGGTFPDGCSCTCGHYTQIVWRETTTVGCGIGDCPGGGQIWVCNYDPPGNYVGQPPF